MKTSWQAFVLVVFCTFLIAFAQLFYKFGAERLPFISWQLSVGLVIYGIGAVLLIFALKYGEASVVYPIFALNFIWVSLLSAYVLNEPMSLVKWIGILGIMIGISLVGIGGKE